MTGKTRNELGTVENREDLMPAEDSAKVITLGVLKQVPDFVQSCQATALFIYVDALDDQTDLNLPPMDVKVFYITKSPGRRPGRSGEEARYLRVPNVPLTRVGQVKIAVLLALAKGLIQQGERVVFVAGLASAKTLDTILVTEVGREYGIFASDADLMVGPRTVLPEVVERVLTVASELGSEGREGRPVGAMFVVGDTDRVLPLTHQLLLNPFKGYPPGERNILDYSLEETVKELATLDGAFLIRGDGVMETCGTYIRPAGHNEYELPRGLGARHYAAAAVTAATDCIAITVSESTGSVTVFRGGRIVTEIQRPRAAGHGASTFPPPRQT
jgi:diadenylate cyclase